MSHGLEVWVGHHLRCHTASNKSLLGEKCLLLLLLVWVEALLTSLESLLSPTPEVASTSVAPTSTLTIRTLILATLLVVLLLVVLSLLISTSWLLGLTRRLDTRTSCSQMRKRIFACWDIPGRVAAGSLGRGQRRLPSSWLGLVLLLSLIDRLLSCLLLWWH